MVTRRLALAQLAALLASCTWMGEQADVPDRDEDLGAVDAIKRGTVWLRSQQSSQGAFPSQTYGLLAGGQSLTPFALLALLSDPIGQPRATDDFVVRAVEWMLATRDRRGALGFAAPVPDYPVYATSMMLSVLARIRLPGWQQAAAPSVSWLRSQQYTPEQWGDHPAAGGFGMGLLQMPSPPHAGHVDLSMTRRAIEGLRAVGLSPQDPALQAARSFVMRCHAEGGGFLYSPVEPVLNKGWKDKERYRGYGSATTDGVLALLALGEPVESKLIQDEVAWLAQNHRTDRNPGITDGPYLAFAEAMRGYYRAGSSMVFARTSGPAGWRDGLVRAIVAEQREDGSWVNAAKEQKEDDPIIATSFALLALASVVAPGQ